MMIHAYDKLYLEKARSNLARMLDFAVYDLSFNIDEFFDLFISSGVASLFEAGDINTIAGKSGAELAYSVLGKSGITHKRIKPNYTYNRSPEYWTGWALAYYQWEKDLSFKTINKYISIREILFMYSAYHEMDIRQFVDQIDNLIRENRTESNLKMYRRLSGLSQRELANASDIPLRTIQQYEQRQKNINKAQAEYILRLADALSCKPEEILEKV